MAGMLRPPRKPLHAPPWAIGHACLSDPSDLRRKSRQKSRIGNGSSILNGVDGRLVWPRRFKELFADHMADTPDASVAERSILRRVCTLEVELERMETMFALAGEASPEAIDLYARCAANLRRLLESVSAGLQRKPRDVTPDPLAFAKTYTNGDG
jgi:hypothetical protein